MKSETISAYLQSRIKERDFPSAVYLVAEKGEIVFQDALGYAVVEPERIEARIDTIYDLASLTKPLVTGLLCVKAVEQNKIKPGKIFIASRSYTAPDKDVVVSDLLTHTSGFPAWKPLYLIAKEPTPRWILETWIDEWKENQEPRRVTYSDLNFIELKLLLETLYERRRLDEITKTEVLESVSFDKIAKTEIFEPLNLRNTFFNPPSELKKRIAASELGNAYEKQMCVDLGYDVEQYKWRDYQIWGEVHDGNCFFMNGVSGHAGLFASAEDVFKIAQQFLANQTVLLKPETCQLFRTNYTPHLNEARSIAFQLAATKDSTAGEYLAKDSFGHLGFTGTSLWIEPQTERIFILLTNRTHHRELPLANINAVRREFHNLAVLELNEKFRITR